MLRGISNYWNESSWRITDSSIEFRFLKNIILKIVFVVVVKLVSCVRFFATPWTAECQASLSFTISWSLLKLTSIESVMPSKHLILCCALLLLPSTFPSIRSYTMSQLFASGDQSIRASDSASVSPMNTQDWFPLGLTGSISLQAKGLSRVFYNTTVQKHQHFGAQPSLWSNSHIQKTQWKLKYTLTLLLNNVVP